MVIYFVPKKSGLRWTEQIHIYTLAVSNGLAIWLGGQKERTGRLGAEAWGRGMRWTHERKHKV